LISSYISILTLSTEESLETTVFSVSISFNNLSR